MPTHILPHLLLNELLSFSEARLQIEINAVTNVQSRGDIYVRFSLPGMEGSTQSVDSQSATFNFFHSVDVRRNYQLVQTLLRRSLQLSLCCAKKRFLASNVIGMGTLPLHDLPVRGSLGGTIELLCDKKATGMLLEVKVQLVSVEREFTAAVESQSHSFSTAVSSSQFETTETAATQTITTHSDPMQLASECSQAPSPARPTDSLFVVENSMPIHDEAQQLRQQLEELATDLQEAQIKEQRVSQELRRMTDDSRLANARVVQLENQVRRPEGNLLASEEAKASSAFLQDAHSALQEEFQQLQGEYKRLQSDHSVCHGNLEALTRARQANSEIQQRLKAEQAKSAGLIDQLQARDLEINNLRQEKEALTTFNVMLTDPATGKLSRILEEKAELVRDKHLLSREVQQLQDEKRHLQQEIVSHIARSEELEIECQELRIAVTAAESRLREERNKIDQIQLDLAVERRRWNERRIEQTAQLQSQSIELVQAQSTSKKLEALLRQEKHGYEKRLAKMQLEMDSHKVSADVRVTPTSGVHRTAGLDPALQIAPADIVFGATIGTGGFGEVVRAVWRCLPVAVKFVKGQDDVDMIDTLAQECRLMARMRHPNIVQLLGFVCMQGRIYCPVMEFLEGGTVLEYVKRKPPLKVILGFACDVCRALVYMHTHDPKPTVHFDLKCKNLLLTNTTCPSVKLVDFGLSMTMTARHLQGGGTAQWMSPELMRGGRVDERTDIYSFGMVMYEMLTHGSRPFAEYRFKNRQEREEAVLKRGLRPTLPDDVPLKLRLLVEQMWHESAQSRPTPEKLLGEFEALKATFE
eukprot:TRINITY_DN2260_c0_g1_i4.p1 TRINITY_DN2260_c0_g1~~TRINITY_DN2260_c0_g1_i4.p1  ORF type:complete len:811 (-),score=151.16 TRINITY_DN2260_c0_g1_i4:1624-4056(-)